MIGTSVTQENTEYMRGSKASGFKSGDRVKVVRTCHSLVRGWRNSWQPTMDAEVGSIFKIIGCDNGSGFYLEGSGYAFPFFVLESVNEDVEKALRAFGEREPIVRNLLKALKLIA